MKILIAWSILLFLAGVLSFSPIITELSNGGKHYLNTFNGTVQSSSYASCIVAVISFHLPFLFEIIGEMLIIRSASRRVADIRHLLSFGIIASNFFAFCWIRVDLRDEYLLCYFKFCKMIYIILYFSYMHYSNESLWSIGNSAGLASIFITAEGLKFQFHLKYPNIYAILLVAYALIIYAACRTIKIAIRWMHSIKSNAKKQVVYRDILLMLTGIILYIGNFFIEFVFLCLQIRYSLNSMLSYLSIELLFGAIITSIFFFFLCHLWLD